jgi:hypothetical protein
VPIGEITDVAKGSEVAEEEPELREVAPPWPTETPSPVAPEPTPALPPPEEVASLPEPEPAPEPEVIPPLEQVQPEPPPVEQAQVEPPPPEPEAPPPPVEKAEAPTAPAPVPKSRPRPPHVVAQAEPPDNELSEKIAALLDQQKQSSPQAETPASLGSRTGHDGAAMTQTELNALAAKMRGCWSPPLGATGADELRTVVLIRLNRDGSLAGAPQIISRPPGRYEPTAPASVVRAIGRCAPYDLPSDKYAEWREIEFDFYPVDMF